MATAEQFSLRWNNYYSNLTSSFHDLLEAHDMVDVTLAIDGQFLQAHKLVLSICSPLFKQLFKINPCKHPVIILRDVTYGNIKDILEFMYLGEVNVLRDNLSSFLRTAELLQVKGLTGDDSSDTSSKKEDKVESLCDMEEQESNTYNNTLDTSEQNLILPPFTNPLGSSSPPLITPSISNTKRCAKSTIGNLKRPKSDTLANKGSSKVSTTDKQDTTGVTNQNYKEDELTDCSTANYESNVYSFENEDMGSSKEVIKHLLETTGVNSSTSQDNSSQENDVLLFSADSKGHVYCPYCYRKFVNRYNLKVHIRDKHDENPINLDCVICGKTMRNRSCLRVHLYHHRKQNVKAS